MNFRSDLALERREMFAGEIAGIESLRHDNDGISVTHVKIKDNDAAEKIGKPIGNYVTIEIKDLSLPDDEICDRAVNAVSAELKKLIKGFPDASVLVVGLGNRDITPDSIGPKAVGKLTVTRHISKDTENEFNFSLRPVSAIAPGVLGITGIETSEIVKGVIEFVKPQLIIAIDALAARNLSRLGTTLQISDTGITPGSGVGNHRRALNEETLGVPVIAIGVPMVADVLTLAMDIIQKLPKNEQEENEQRLALNIITKRGENMVVTPNDVDIISQQASDIIADAINIALYE